MRSLLYDLRYAVRLLRRQRAFTAAAILALAFGIGTNTTLFTIINAIALRPIPVPDAGEMVRVHPVDRHGVRGQMFSYPDVVTYRDQHREAARVIAYVPTLVTLGDLSAPDGAGERFVPQDTSACLVSDRYFDVLKVHAAIGRTFGPDDSRPGHATVAVIGDRLWKRRFEANPDIVGRAVRINGQWFTIVGIAPPEFVGVDATAQDLWIPVAAQPILQPQNAWVDDRQRTSVLVLARLSAGVRARDLQIAMTATAKQLLRDDPRETRPTAVAIMPATFVTPPAVLLPIIWLAMAAVGLVLVVACANVATLMVARATARQQEIATRLALGASRPRLVRQLMTESALIATIGGLGGLLLAWWSLSLVQPLLVDQIPFAWARLMLNVTPDLRVFSYTLGLSLVASVLCGLAPALQASREGLTRGVIAAAGGAAGSWGRSRLRGALIVVQFAVCLVLLVGSGLFVRSLRHAETLALGFDAAHLLYVEADLATQGYDAPRSAAFVDALAARARQLPGVESVSVASFAPLAMIQRVTRVSLPRREPSAESERVTVRFNMITPEYFTTLRIPIVRGRTFTPAEALYGAPVAVISDVIARRLWPGEDPLGKTLTIGNAKPGPGDDGPFVPSAQIIGVVRDVRAGMLWETQQSLLYLPMRRSEPGRRVSVLVRTARDPHELAATIAQEIRTLDDRLFCYVHPLESLLGLWLLPSRVATIMALVLGSTALLLALVGIYGVMAYAVTDRVREIGIRMALGAQRRDVLELIIGSGMRLVAAGLIAGMLLALVATRSIARFLYGVSPMDPLTLTGTCAFLATVALVACYVPARRAMRIDPLAALRHD